MLKKLYVSCLFAIAIGVSVVAINAPAQASSACSVPNSVISALVSDFNSVTKTLSYPSFFTPKQMWLAIVDREGRLCAPLAKTGDAWPGSRQIAIAKAETANDFSNSSKSLSTAQLYGLTIPGGSLFGLNNSNTFNALADDPRLPAYGYVPGGIITFGGGVALYSGSSVIGGLGVSGDTACADHAVAYDTRALAISAGKLSAPVSFDNITFANPVVPNTTEHPYCTGTETPPTGTASSMHLINKRS